MDANAIEWIMAFTLMGVAVGVIAVYAVSVRRQRDALERRRGDRD
ncbi:MAG: hypothetical protein ABL308_11930 [Oceanicaulis sp.]